jgi:hypothetical protein
LLAITVRNFIASPKDSNFDPSALRALLLLTTAPRRGRIAAMEGAASTALHLSGDVRMERMCIAWRRSWASPVVLRRSISRRMKVVGMQMMWGRGESCWKGTKRRWVNRSAGVENEKVRQHVGNKGEPTYVSLEWSWSTTHSTTEETS